MSWSIEFTKLPATSENRFVAAGNPVQYSIQRKDITGFSVSEQVTPSPTGQMKLTFTGQDLRDYFYVGRKIVLGGISTYNDVTATVISCDLSSGNTRVHLTSEYIIDVSYPNNLFVLFEDVTPSYYAVVSMKIDNKPIQNMRIVPDRFGRATFDVAELCKARLTYPDVTFPRFAYPDNISLGIDVYVQTFWNTDIAQDWQPFPGGSAGSYDAGTDSTVPLYCGLSVGVIKGAKQTTDLFKNNYTRYMNQNYLENPVTSSWYIQPVDSNVYNPDPGPYIWSYDTFWQCTLDPGMSTEELRFVDGPTLPAGFYMLGTLINIYEMGGDKEVIRLQIYDFNKLVQVIEIDILGTQGTPNAYQKNIEYYINKQFNRVTVQVFNPGSGILVNFSLNVFRFIIQMKMLTLFDSKFISIWRNMPFTFNAIMYKLISDGSPVMEWIQYRQDGTSIQDGATGIDFSTTGPFTTDPNDQKFYVGTVTRFCIRSKNVAELTGNVNVPYIHKDAAKIVIKLLYNSSNQWAESFVLNVKELCPNSIMLYWKNSLGGDSWWLFEHSQDYEHRYDDGRKTRRMTLYADGLTPVEWDAINDINRPTDVTRVYSDDFTVENRTSIQDGSKMFIVDQQLTLTGVVSIPTEYPYETKKAKRSIKIVIELPDIYVP